jgi:cytochrome c553
MIKGRSWPLVLAALAVQFAGCGTNLNEVLFQSVAATGRTLSDLWLTDFENRLADSLDPNGAPTGDGGSTTDQGGGGSDQGNGSGTGGGDGSTDLTGDPAAGQTVFTTNNCAACHCADASGGCALSAPPIAGVASDTIDARLRGDATHPLKVELSDQDLADLQAYLAS